VILVDANLLVYAHIAEMRQHERARVWLDEHLNGAARVGLPWAALVAFVRLVSNPRILKQPRTVVQGWRQVESWLGCATAWIPSPTEQHREALGRLLTLPGMNANLVPDAHLAALAIEHGVTLCSADTDFARFPGLKWENPLAP
jgi:toxin-antitoxin system PIN domain toxin